MEKCFICQCRNYLFANAVSNEISYKDQLNRTFVYQFLIQTVLKTDPIYPK